MGEVWLKVRSVPSPSILLHNMFMYGKNVSAARE